MVLKYTRWRPIQWVIFNYQLFLINDSHPVTPRSHYTWLYSHYFYPTPCTTLPPSLQVVGQLYMAILSTCHCFTHMPAHCYLSPIITCGWLNGDHIAGTTFLYKIVPSVNIPKIYQINIICIVCNKQNKVVFYLFVENTFIIFGKDIWLVLRTCQISLRKNNSCVLHKHIEH